MYSLQYISYTVQTVLLFCFYLYILMMQRIFVPPILIVLLTYSDVHEFLKTTHCLPQTLPIIFLKRLLIRLLQLMGNALDLEMSGQGCPPGSDVSALMP